MAEPRYVNGILEIQTEEVIVCFCFIFVWFFFVCLFVFTCTACRILVPQPGIKLTPHALGTWSLNDQVAREVLEDHYFEMMMQNSMASLGDPLLLPGQHPSSLESFCY